MADILSQAELDAILGNIGNKQLVEAILEGEYLPVEKDEMNIKSTERVTEDLFSKIDHIVEYLLENEIYFGDFLSQEAKRRGVTVCKLIEGLIHWRKEELNWLKSEKENFKGD
jgi:flagellar motor switch protein FliM